MSASKSALSLQGPILITVSAILALLTSLMIASGSPRMLYGCVIYASTGVTVAAAVVIWVSYFHAYVDWRIEQRFPQSSQDSPTK